ncbi:hypothetical protein ABTE27_22200, partial [Acinetobacter baumannii]
NAIFVAVPFLAGLDKFFNLITDWEKYVSPTIKPLVPLSEKQIMRATGVAEIGVGLLTCKRPVLGSLIFVGMMSGIVLNLLTMKK